MEEKLISRAPLQNRVQPDGEIVSAPQRGTLLGNRGGRIHDPDTKQLFPKRRWASRQWICCVLEFKNRQRDVMGPGSYTELFFLDEVTALAAGHRPCFECRRKAAISYAEAWQRSEGAKLRPAAKEMDAVLHEERLNGRRKRTRMADWDSLPDGVVVAMGEDRLAKREGRSLIWTFDGYIKTENIGGMVECLTPPHTVAALENGYTPLWHSSPSLA